MAKKKKIYAKMQCTECDRVNYLTRKSKQFLQEKLELKKYCKWCKKHTLHKEKK
ncbi:MAG: 50S ribosomal protein L33 [Candidatus Nealsonbacteria bacterium]|nr:50S ribosomal protein L33 [Candidatus Nealsonbacteria bacterium]